MIQDQVLSVMEGSDCGIRPTNASSHYHPYLTQEGIPMHVINKPTTLTEQLTTQAIQHDNSDATHVPSAKVQSKLQRISIIATLGGVSLINSMGSGILISALPGIAKDIGLDENLLLWPAAVYALAAGCLLLFFGAISDVVGVRLIWLTGSLFYTAFILAVGLSETGIQMIAFRALSGASIAMCLPTAVSLITNTFARGTWRNVAFAMNGMAQPLGFALGLILGGIFTDSIGWRWSYYMSAIINACLCVVCFGILPTIKKTSNKPRMRSLVEDIDWVGTFILSAALGILLYVLAMITSSYTNLSDIQNIVLLVVSACMLCCFPLWMNFQVKYGRPAVMPNKIWRSTRFTAACIAVFFCWSSLTAIEYFITLYFQEIQQLSALQSSVRFLPHVIAGVVVEILTGWLVSRVRVQILGVVSALVTLTSGPLMATIRIGDTYWYAAFWAMLLSPVSADVLFTVSNLVISDAFEADLQSLAGGVFNEVSQFGNAVGLAVTAAIAASVTAHQESKAGDSVMDGYRAAFWTISAAQGLVVIIAFLGFRKGSLVGKKDD